MTLRDAWPKLARVIVALAVVVWGVYFAAGRVLSAESLTITTISVSGNSRISRGEVVALLEGLRGQHMLMVDLDDWRTKLLASPWVAEAAIRRVFPGTVAVAVRERQPLGLGRINNTLYLIDRRGMVIDEYGPNYAEFDLPIVDGLAAHGGADGMLVDEERAQLAARVLSELGDRPDLIKQVSQVDVTDARDAVLILKNDTVLLHVGDQQFIDRLQAYRDLAAALRDRVEDIDSVDLRFDERIYVRSHDGRPGRARAGVATARTQKGAGG